MDRGVPASVGKQVALYLSRVAPRQTIDHLVYELSQQLTAPEAAGEAAAEGGTPLAATPKILEFHSRRSAASLAQPQLQSLQRPSPSVGGGAGGSRPTTPGSIAGSAAFSRRVGLDALLQTQSAWSEGGSSAGGAGEGLGGAKVLSSEIESRRSSEVRLGESASARRGVLTRPELALCLLSEIAYEHDEEFRRHLPTLLHVATLVADSGDLVVREEGSQLLIYLLYSLACKHLEAQAGGTSAPEYTRVSRLIARLQALHGQPLWRREQPTLLQPLVASSLSVAAFVQAGEGAAYLSSFLLALCGALALFGHALAASFTRGLAAPPSLGPFPGGRLVMLGSPPWPTPSPALLPLP